MAKQESKNPQQIDIGKVIAKKFGKRLPRMIIRSLERLIVQDEINFVLRSYGHLEGMDFVAKLMNYFGITLEIVGQERLPEDGRALFVCNHPLGALDGICLSHLIGSHYQSEIRYIVNDMLLALEPFRHIFVPVNTLSGQSRESVQKLNDALASPYPVITFPAGICSRLIDGEVTDLPWKNSFIKQAIRSNRPIVPLYFNGLNSRSFYKIESLRKRLGIKFNIGTALLPRQMFKAKGSHYIVAVGEAIPCEALQQETTNYQTLSQMVRQKVYQLPKEFQLEK